jgi:hypothetical protein
MFTFVYICLHLFTFVNNNCLQQFMVVYISKYVYVCLHLYMFAYICLRLFTFVDMFTFCLLFVYFLFTVCLLFVYFLFTFCLLFVYFLFTFCLLFVYFLFTFVYTHCLAFMINKSVLRHCLRRYPTGKLIFTWSQVIPL